MRITRFVLLFCGFLALILHAECCAQDDGLTPEQAKNLIPEAASLPAVDALQFAQVDLSKFKPSVGDALTWVVLSHMPGPDTPKNPTSFRFVGETLAPTAIAKAIEGPKDKDGKTRKWVSLIHPEYITECTCKVDGATATGTVTFKAEKVYEGKVEYTARKKDGKWRVEEFRLPEFKITTVLGPDGKWVKK